VVGPLLERLDDFGDVIDALEVASGNAA